MDFTRYSKYLSSQLFGLLKDLDAATGIEVSDLPQKNLVQTNARYILNKNSVITEYIKLKDGELHSLGGGGSDSREIELQKTETYLQWKYTDATEWTNLIAISEITGSAGTPGTDGEEIELQKSADHVQWRYVGDSTWTDLIALSDITGSNGTNGTNGEEVFLRVDSGYIQWKYTTDISWANLIALTSLKGDTGDPGTNGSNAFVYIAYASDSSGTGFTLTFNSSLDYIAVKATTTAIPSPIASDFTGLWKKYKGEPGTNGTNGQGVPVGGTTNQILAKASSTDYDTHWITQAAAEILFSLLPANCWGFQLMDFTTNDIVLV